MAPRAAVRASADKLWKGSTLKSCAALIQKLRGWGQHSEFEHTPLVILMHAQVGERLMEWMFYILFPLSS